MQTHSHGHGLVDISTNIKETLKTQNHQCHLSLHLCIPGVGISVQGQEIGLFTGMAPLPPPFSSGFFILRQVPTPHHVESLCINVERTGTCVVWPLQTSLTGATLSLPNVLRDILKRDSQGPCRLLGVNHLLSRDDWCCMSVSRCTCHAGSHLKVGFTNCSRSLLH